MKKLIAIFLLFQGHLAFSQHNIVNLRVPTDSILSRQLPISMDTFQVLASKIESIKNDAQLKIDSVAQSYQRTVSNIQKYGASCQHSLDSLRQLNLGVEKYKKKIDSLQNELALTHQRATAKILSIKEKTGEKINSLQLPPELRQKVSGITGSLDQLNLPLLRDFKSPIDLSGFNSTLGQMKSSNVLSSIKGLPSTDALNGIAGNIKGVTGSLGVVDEASQIQQQGGSMLGQVNQGIHVDKVLESQLAKVDGVKLLNETTGSLPANAMPTENEAKEKLIQEAKEAAVDHFVGKEKVLQGAMERMSKLKAKYSSLNSLSEIPRKRSNEMRGKPLVERIVPGVGIQVLKKSDYFLIDFNPYVGYRFTPRITGGIGWNQRVPLNFRDNKYSRTDVVYGPRLFSEYKLGKGFSPRVEIEMMSTFVPVVTSPGNPEFQTRQWIFGAFVGMKREYRFIKNVKGTALIMLRVLNHIPNSPYSDVLNVRFGFEFPIKKKIRPASS